MTARLKRAGGALYAAVANTPGGRRRPEAYQEMTRSEHEDSSSFASTPRSFASATSAMRSASRASSDAGGEIAVLSISAARCHVVTEEAGSVGPLSPASPADLDSSVQEVRRQLSFLIEPLSAEEEQAVCGLAARVKERKFVLPPGQEHFYLTLLRFVRARDNNVEKAEEMLANMLEWRKQFGTDELYRDGFDYPEHSEVLKHYPHACHKVDKIGRPLFVQLMGKVKPAELLKVTTQDRLERNHVHAWEVLLNDIFPKCSHDSGKQKYSTFTIFDLQGVSLFQFHASRASLQRVSQLDQDNYPEFVGELFLINTPWIFKTIWAMMQPWLGKRTQQKITMLGTDYLEELLKHVDVENLPSFFGGKCTCNEHGGCMNRPWSS
eukprot:CAMPEP_0196587188 /NCGR_PEP_ID=MMETSP1081-20130531/56692_1 /TAXON_ID=36882 /ORGANISM="Pyramimonas amylifera, Strain CCMP720" /LENGTH=379 /DNA_ID=CAMNT_0041909295 /DNA_START=758 /DNA_END=1897 /DNA_ORIENTATION=-